MRLVHKMGSKHENAGELSWWVRCQNVLFSLSLHEPNEFFFACPVCSHAELLWDGGTVSPRVPRSVPCCPGLGLPLHLLSRETLPAPVTLIDYHKLGP